MSKETKVTEETVNADDTQDEAEAKAAQFIFKIMQAVCPNPVDGLAFCAGLLTSMISAFGKMAKAKGHKENKAILDATCGTVAKLIFDNGLDADQVFDEVKEMMALLEAEEAKEAGQVH